MGFGVVEPVFGRIDTRPLFDWLAATAGSHYYPTLPSLRNVFLAQIKPKNSNDQFTDQTTFALKYDLRRLYASDQKLRHFVMGTVMDGRIAAKVKISRPYGEGLMRVWGWIPEDDSVYGGHLDREAVVEAIYQHLNANYTLHTWREMNSRRDTSAPNTSDWKAYTQSLLSLEDDANAA